MTVVLPLSTLADRSSRLMQYVFSQTPGASLIPPYWQPSHLTPQSRDDILPGIYIVVCQFQLLEKPHKPYLKVSGTAIVQTHIKGLYQVGAEALYPLAIREP